MTNDLERAERAEDALSRRDELYALVIHDLRNPLNTISMSCALLADDVQGTAKETLARIKRAVDRMEKLMRDVSEMGRLEQGQVKIELVSLSVADLLSRAFEPFIQRAAPRGLKLETQSVDPALRISIDRERVMWALHAMIDNAVKMAPDGGVVTLSAVDRGDYVDLVVSDNGPGLSAEDKATVFERHRRINKKRGQGLALGLAQASMIVALHGGSVGVESDVGKGATFWMRFKKS
jgi:signal transduction histidine kinase